MHCPNCGMKASAGQKFCRACGFGLEKVAQLIAEHHPETTGQISEEAAERLRRRLSIMDRAWVAMLAVLGGGFVTSIIWAIVDKIITEKRNVLGGIIFIAFILGLVAVGLSTIYLEAQRKKLADRQSPRSQPEPDAETTNQLLPGPDAATRASVIEHTTAKLEERLKS